MEHQHTDPTHLELTTSQPPVRPARSRRRGIVVAAALTVAAAAGAVLAGAGGSSSTGGRASSPAGTNAVVADAASRPDAQSVGSDPASSGGGASVSPPPQPPEPPQPAAPGHLKVSTAMIHLPDGVYQGSFVVKNDGGSPADWQWAAGNYGIAVSQNGGTLAPDEHVVVSFTINPFQLQVGDFLFANCIYNETQSLDVTITGYRKPIVVNPDIPLPAPELTTKQ